MADRVSDAEQIEIEEIRDRHQRDAEGYSRSARPARFWSQVRGGRADADRGRLLVIIERLTGAAPDCGHRLHPQVLPRGRTCCEEAADRRLDRCDSRYGGDRCTLRAGHEGHHFAIGSEWVADSDTDAGR